MDKKKNRFAACLVVLLLTLFFPAAFYGFLTAYKAAAAWIEKYLPFLAQVSDFLEIDWFEILAAILFGFLVSLAGSLSEKVCPTREGARYAAAGFLSAVMTAVECVIPFLLPIKSGHRDVSGYYLFMTGLAQFSYTVSMFFVFRRSGRLAMLFRKKHVTVFAARDSQKTTKTFAVVRSRKSLIRKDGSVDRENLFGMLQAVIEHFPDYSGMPGKTVIPCRLEHLKAVYRMQFEIGPDPASGNIRLIRTEFADKNEERGIPVEIINHLLQVPYQWK